MDEPELCVCFHVPFHKVEKFIRLNDPQFPSQCSECFSAGTGCGWCIPFIEKLFEDIKNGEDAPRMRLAGEEYRERRREYLEKVKMNRMAPKPPDGGPPPDDEMEVDLIE